MPQAEKPSTTPSLPGALSRRTDGGVASKQAQRYISGMPNYGDGQDMANLQAQAPVVRLREGERARSGPGRRDRHDRRHSPAWRCRPGSGHR